MSWSIGTDKPVQKWEAEQHIDRLEVPSYVTGPALEQFAAAQRAAKELLKTVPGPFVRVTLAGHAHGCGWHKDAQGSANETITVSVTQFCDEDMKHYNKE